MNNFEVIRSFLTFDNPDTLYYIQVLQRRKDIPDLSIACKKSRSYYIRCIEDFDNAKQSIINECEQKQARAYIDLNAKDVKKIALLALKKTAEHIYNNEYDAVRKVYDYACGNSTNLGQKLWLIDIDTQDENTINQVRTNLIQLNATIQIELPSKTGLHIITHPFPSNMFPKIENVDVLKHGLTVLYAAS